MSDNKQLLLLNRQNVELTKADYEQFLLETKDPFGTNEKLLLKIVDDNKDTEYGRKYHFGDIKCYEDYKANVPVIKYDNITNYIDRIVEGEKNLLFKYPCEHLCETSGTVGKPKYIPMTDAQISVFLKYDKHYLDTLYTKELGEAWMGGRLFCTSQGQHTTAPSGITLGDASSKMASLVSGGRDGFDNLMRTFYTSPVEAICPEPGIDTKYIHLRFAMMDKEVRGIVTGFYCLLVLYFHYIEENYQMLINDIENGTIDASVDLPPEVRESLLKKIEPMPERARELREIFRNGSDFKFVNAIWPNLCFIFGVGGDGFSVYANTLRNKYVEEDIKFILSGIKASEGLWSVPVEANNEDAVLVPGGTFMEFLPVEAENDFSKCVTIDQLEVGHVYELIITAFNGLYRYRMGDSVMVTGYLNKTPRVRFMYRVEKTVNLTGEKTTEKILKQSVENAAEELGFDLLDFTVYPNANTIPPRYEFLVQTSGSVPDIPEEKLSESIEKYLCEANNLYEYDIAITKLQPAVAYWLQPETTFLWRDLEVAKGRSVSQLKPLRVISNEAQKKFFYCLRENH